MTDDGKDQQVTTTDHDHEQEQADDGDEHVRPFGAFLHEQRNGLLHAELSDGLHDLLAAVRDVGKGGTLTLTVRVKPAGSDATTVIVADDLKVKLPQGDRGESIFYITDDNNLSREDPRQQKFELREAPAAREARSIS